MALSLTIFLIILGVALLTYVLGMMFKVPHLFLFGCVLLFGSGALLWGFDGLITGNYYALDGSLAETIVPISNLGLTLFSTILVAVPIISFLTINLGNIMPQRHVSPFHY
jgi:hypothetical protein